MLYDDKKFIGNIIRNARKKANLNQAELSERLGMSEKNLGNIENGKQFPQVNNFLKIIEVLGLTLKDFGVNIDIKNDNDLKEQLVNKILSASNGSLELYKKAIMLVDDVVVSLK